ncbi:MAG: hypothetical protein WAS33_08210 [Candidatus Promineifilaceae bacterium]|nr:hypothetical protein [Anaerolineaceae bacterium]
MKRIVLFFLLMSLLWGTAVSCGAVTEEEAPPTSAPAENDEGGALNAAPANSGSEEEAAPETDADLFPRATLTPAPPVEAAAPEGAEGYPAAPLPTPLPEGYSLPPTIPPLNPYPEASGTLVWVIKPVGEQCAETPTTPDLQTAVADMIAFGIPVEASEMTELSVCTACGCPTSAHFRLQIDSGYLANAAVLGWMAEE